MKISDKDYKLLVKNLNDYITFCIQMDEHWVVDGKTWPQVIEKLSDEERWANAILDYDTDSLDYAVDEILEGSDIDFVVKNTIDNLFTSLSELEYISGLTYPGPGNWCVDKYNTLDFENSEGIEKEEYDFPI